jgi:hypothetical protein
MLFVFYFAILSLFLKLLSRTPGGFAVSFVHFQPAGPRILVEVRLKFDQ